MKEPTGCIYWNKPEDITSDGFDFIERFDDSSHLLHALLKCRECGQLYFYEFYEEIDWENGNDPQYVTYIPVDSEEEVERLKTMSSFELLTVFPRLQQDYPKDANAPQIRWVSESCGDS